MKVITKIISLFLIICSLLFVAGCEDLGGSNVDITGSRTKYTDELKLTQIPTSTSSFDTDGVSYATVVRYVDGDTTQFSTLLSSGKTSISIRYLGLDTPESTYKVEPWGIAAAQFTRSKLESAQSIVLQKDPSGLLDTNGRYLGYVWYRTSELSEYRLLNLELVEEAYSSSKGMSDKLYKDVFYSASTRAQGYKDRTNGEEDPTYDYNAIGQKYTIKQIIDTFGTPEAIASEELKGAKVYIEGLVTRKIGVASAYIEQVNEGYYKDDETGESVFVPGDNKTYGLYVYGGFEQNLKLEVGNYIITNANVSYHTGALQVVGVNNVSIQVQSTGNTVTPQAITSANWNNIDSSLICRLVSLKNLTVTGGKDDDNTDAYTIYTKTADNTQINIRIDANVTIKVDENGVISPNGFLKNKTWEAFKNINFTEAVGIIQPYYTGYQLIVTSINDLTY